MRNALALIAAIISASGSIPYITDIVKGKTHPNVVTWLTYSLINAINTFAALNSGAPRTAILSAFACAATGAIAFMGFKHGVKKYTAFDITCQALAIAGLIAWQLSGSPTIAVAIALFVQIVASLPTWHHAWTAPYAETWEGFVLGGLGSLITLTTLTEFGFVAIAFPAAITINSLILITIILGRRRATPEHKPAAG